MHSDASDTSTSLPAGACDCHAHVFGPRERYPLQAAPDYLPTFAPWPDYLATLRRMGCQRAVLVQPSPYGTDHAAMLDAMASGDFTLRGIALIDDTISDAQLEVLHVAGVRGFRAHLMPDTPLERIAQFRRSAERVKGLGWHLEVYCTRGWRADTCGLLDAMPLPVVIDHFGLVEAARGTESEDFRALLRLADREHYWFKLSAPYRSSQRNPDYLDVLPLAQALLAAAPERCVWGSDWPHPNAERVPAAEALVGLLHAWIPDAALRARVLVDNPARLYDF